MVSILEHLGTEEVPRLRLGVGGAEAEDLVCYVLQTLSDGGR